MSLSFVLGNFVGRAAFSYLLVFVICFLASRLQLRPAFARSRRWYSVLSVILLTLLGMGAAVVNSGKF